MPREKDPWLFVHLCHFIKNVLFGQRFPRWLRFSNRSETVLIGKMFWKPFNKKLHPWTATQKKRFFTLCKTCKHTSVPWREGGIVPVPTSLPLFLSQERVTLLQYLLPGSVCVFVWRFVWLSWYDDTCLLHAACSLALLQIPDSPSRKAQEEGKDYTPENKHGT